MFLFDLLQSTFKLNSSKSNSFYVDFNEIKRLLLSDYDWKACKKRIMHMVSPGQVDPKEFIKESKEAIAGNMLYSFEIGCGYLENCTGICTYHLETISEIADNPDERLAMHAMALLLNASNSETDEKWRDPTPTGWRFFTNYATILLNRVDMYIDSRIWTRDQPKLSSRKLVKF